MTGTSCAFILTKCDYVGIDSGYHEASGYVGGFNPRDV